MNINRLIYPMLLCSIVFTGATPMSGQIGRGTITGIVRDPTDSAAPGLGLDINPDFLRKNLVDGEEFWGV